MKKLLAQSVIIVLISSLVFVGWVWLRPDAETAPAPLTPDFATTEDNKDSEATGDAESAAEALNLLEEDPEALLPTELAGEFGDKVKEAVPAGTRVSADPTTWLPSTVGGGVIEAQLDYPDGTSERLAIVMMLESGQWKVLQTIPLEGAQ